MKLAKKMLASVLALAMVAALALTAFAAAPSVKITATDAVVGQTVKVTVAGVNIAGLESADIELKYDTEALEFVSAKAAAMNGALPAAGKASDGVCTVSFAYTEAAVQDDAFATYEFKVLKAGDTTVTVTATSWDGIDEPTINPLVIKAHEPVVTPPVTTTAAPVEDGSKEPSTKPSITQTGEAGIAAIAGVMALAAVAFVATRKKDEE